MGKTLFRDDVSALILSLHSGLENGPAAQYKPWALTQLRQLLDFNAAHWISRTGTEDKAPVMDDYRLDLPMQNDKAAVQLCASWCDEQTSLNDSITLYRSTGSSAFTHDDRTLLELLLPHMSTGYQQNLLDATHAPTAESGAYAICNITGMLYRASNAFTDLLLTETPDWQGPILPWASSLKEARRSYLEIKGERVFLRARRSESLFHLHIRPRRPMDELTEAELRVARKLATGSSYKAAAQHLKLSPSTINNHAAAIYRKLGVSNKATLVSRWQELGGETNRTW